MVWTCLFLALSAAAGKRLEPGDHTRELEVDGRTRRYVVHVPSAKVAGTLRVP